MFVNLSDKLQRVFKGRRGEGKLTAENMEAAPRAIDYTVALQWRLGEGSRFDAAR